MEPQGEGVRYHDLVREGGDGRGRGLVPMLDYPRNIGDILEVRLEDRHQHDIGVVVAAETPQEDELIVDRPVIQGLDHDPGKLLTQRGSK